MAVMGRERTKKRARRSAGLKERKNEGAYFGI